MRACVHCTPGRKCGLVRLCVRFCVRLHVLVRLHVRLHMRVRLRVRVFLITGHSIYDVIGPSVDPSLFRF